MGSDEKSRTRRRRRSLSPSPSPDEKERSRKRRKSDGREGKNRKDESGSKEKKEKKRDKSHKHSKSRGGKEKKSKEKHKQQRKYSESFEELSKDDYFAKNNEFATWLKEERGMYFSDLSSDAARELFSTFVKAWNSQNLQPQYYEGITTGPRTAHNWKIKRDK
ncbi:hypothetical protein Cni_G12089 [Canna indica]|uniref:Style cell-cycle inhibitor 1-A n=1 Tax=Canna indica TaxID=4628 RepID=A0AAQ3K7S1_9LILI|nr:hypothetical protein Cni_G12089 [Canna indica]